MPGQVSRSARFWSEWFEDRPLVRIGSSERFFVLAETAEGCVGYLCYRLDYGALREQPVAVIHVEDLVAHGDARRALWRFCLEFTQAAEGRAWNVPVDDSVRWLPDVLRDIEVTALRHFLHLRLVDVPTALTARNYTNAGSVVLDLTDPVLPSNAGRFALKADSGNTSCLPTDLPADVRLSVNDLAAVYLGAVSFRTLIAAGRVTCTTEVAAGKLDEMFQVDRAPWTVTDW
jgi:predicted acetyltransferase